MIDIDDSPLTEDEFELLAEAGKIDRSQSNIADVLGIDESRVSQLERSALAKLARNRKLRELARQFEEQQSERDGRAA